MIKKRQHYVFRYYLKAWTNNNDRIYCLRDNKIFETSLMNVAQEKYFYKIQEMGHKEIDFIQKIFIETTKNQTLKMVHSDLLNIYTHVHNSEIKQILGEEEHKKLATNFEEDYHSKIENDGIKYLTSIRDRDINFYYNKNTTYKMEFLFFIFIQYTRTNKMKNQVIKSLTEADCDVEKIWSILGQIVAQQLTFGLIQDKTFHLTIIENKTGVNFITGDQPVFNTYGVNNHNELQKHEFELYYPITPKVAILLANDLNERNVTLVNIEDVNKYNQMIYDESHSQIFSNSKEGLEKFIH